MKTDLDEEFKGYGFTEKTRDIFALCKDDIGNTEFFALWYQKSFDTETPLTQTNKNDIKKWIKRFKKGTPFTEMDDIRIKIYIKELKNRYNF